MKDEYKVSLLSLKSCLLNLPHALARSLAAKNVPAQRVVLVLTQTTKKAYAGWTGHTSAEAERLEIDPAFARNVGLSEGSKVTIEIRISPREADVVWVEPQTADDWEIMELHASFLEVNLISQIRAVSLLHPLTIYLNNHTTATIIVKKIEPELGNGDQFAKISEFAEIVVSPKTRQPLNRSLSKAKSVTSTKSRVSVTERQRHSIFLRCIPDPDPELRGNHAKFSNTIVRANPGMLNYVKIQAILPPSLSRQTNDEIIAPPLPVKGSEDRNTIVSSSVVAHAIGSDQILEGHVKLSRAIMLALDLQVGSRVKLTPASAPQKLSNLTFHTVISPNQKKEIKIGSKKDADRMERFKAELISLGHGPICHGQRLPSFVVTLERIGDWATLPEIDKISIAKGGDLTLPARVEHKMSVRRIKGTERLEVKVKKTLLRSGGVLLFGARGCGKTAISQACCDEASQNYFHTVQADCSKLSEERIPTIKEAINHWFSTAAWYEPSVIFMDDLDRLCPAEVEHADSTRARQVAEVFLSAMRNFTARHAISILATSQSKESLHGLLTTSHVFDETISIKPPDKVARREILESLVEDDQDVDWLEVANLTEGYLAGDLSFLTERARHEGLMRVMTSEVSSENYHLQTADYVKAITGFTPASLRGIKLQKSTVEWKDIGGLEETRRILLETLEWPTRYAPIFANCPLRLRSGLLLYGYPGCGKTLLASAVAAECGLNFISVKGPEILNKYIGASEKSVRDLFDRAQAAKPCVLFFDEFDSIAPKRGHDSTGVTDRVVNQMLTQMDGAEGLDGVYVLAATSRPDLIDPALLRPGRLDKSLLCDMPNTNDRKSILEALAQKMHLAPDVDLQKFAAKTEGFSGADLQATLYNAHLDAIHTVLQRSAEVQTHSTNGAAHREPTTFTKFRLSAKEKMSGPTSSTLAETAAATARVEAILNSSRPDASKASSGVPDSNPVIEIRQQNLDTSLASTKPSISLTERRRLDRIYREFVDGRSPDGLRDGTVPAGEQRATLA